jgi:hypothetical protein
MGAESERVAQFGRLEDGLRAPGTDWYRWGPYVSIQAWAVSCGFGRRIRSRELAARARQRVPG